MENLEQIDLSQNQIDLWIIKPDDIQDSELLARYEQLMSPSEREKQQRYKFAEDRHDALITRAFVRTVLSKYAPIAPQDWAFVKGEKGKPEIANATLPLRFNLSHTKGLIVCAVALNVNLGVDVEYIKRKTSTLKVAKFKFSDIEYAELMSQPEQNQRKRFFDYWTLKESYIKAVGGGLSIPLDQFSFNIKDDNNISMTFDQRRHEDASQWQNWLLYANEDHRVAISIKDPNRQQHHIRFLQTLPLVKSWVTQLPL
jgi:4'-phosphopantetheinyl transferase